MATLESPLVLALNRLLEAEAWARERLAPFAGETVELRAPPLPALRFAIVEGGRLAPGARAAANASPSDAASLAASFSAGNAAAIPASTNPVPQPTSSRFRAPGK